MVRYRSEKTALGPVQALRSAEDSLDGPTMILGAGLLTDTDLSKAMAFHRDRHATATFVLPEEEIEAMGIACDETGRILRGPTNPKAAAHPGIFILEPDVLEHFDTASPGPIEENLIGHLSARNVPVFVHRTAAYWNQIDSPDRYLQAHADLLKGRLPMDAFRLTGFEADAPIRDGSLIHPGAAVHETAHVESSVIGPNCSISAGVRVVDSVLWSGNSVGERAQITGSILGRGCFVGSSVVLPRGTVLGGKSSITEFSRFSPS
jgi:NDP-sugar pyrophosphorylase family protein